MGLNFICKQPHFSSIAELHGSKLRYNFFQNSLHFAMCKLHVAFVLYTYFILMLFRKFLISLYRNFVVPTMFECTTNVSYMTVTRVRFLSVSIQNRSEFLIKCLEVLRFKDYFCHLALKIGSTLGHYISKMSKS